LFAVVSVVSRTMSDTELVLHTTTTISSKKTKVPSGLSLPSSSNDYTNSMVPIPEHSGRDSSLGISTSSRRQSSPYNALDAHDAHNSRVLASPSPTTASSPGPMSTGSHVFLRDRDRESSTVSSTRSPDASRVFVSPETVFNDKLQDGGFMGGGDKEVTIVQIDGPEETLKVHRRKNEFHSTILSVSCLVRRFFSACFTRRRKRIEWRN